MTAIDIAALPVAEKLKLMEALWDSLCTPTDKGVESPPWHAAALKQAEDDLAVGTARSVDWAEAKDGLRRALESTHHF
jgi:Putative addiction module component